ncbi:MAG: TfoX/Sxy family protein [Nitrospira sp.]|jgi:DNA transformation protein|nr:TfoX/Sxy family protein [Nitrospira sp.]MDI3466995.1 TfoX domain protein [Nitrospira sp.]
MSAKNDGFKDFILDQLTELDGVAARPMFGGYGLYQSAEFFGIIHKGRLYFKVSATTVLNYKKHGMKPFQPNPKQTLTSFYEVPIDVIEDAEVLTQWAAEAVEK